MKKTVTFTCFNQDCDVVKTKSKSEYDKSSKHFCCRACYNSAKVRKTHDELYTEVTCEYPLCGKNFYKRTSADDRHKFHHCNIECKKAHTKYNLELYKEAKKPKKRKLTFKEKWEEMEWANF